MSLLPSAAASHCEDAQIGGSLVSGGQPLRRKGRQVGSSANGGSLRHNPDQRAEGAGATSNKPVATKRPSTRKLATPLYTSDEELVLAAIRAFNYFPCSMLMSDRDLDITEGVGSRVERMERVKAARLKAALLQLAWVVGGTYDYQTVRLKSGGVECFIDHHSAYGETLPEAIVRTMLVKYESDMERP